MVEIAAVFVFLLWDDLVAALTAFGACDRMESWVAGARGRTPPAARQRLKYYARDSGRWRRGKKKKEGKKGAAMQRFNLNNRELSLSLA